MATTSAAASAGFDRGGPTLAEIGEGELLRLLGEIAGVDAGAAELVVPTGDDAAVWRPPPGRDIAVSQDALVEGEDFRRDWITPEELGSRAFEVAVSDLAGTGAVPMLCLATLCAPAGTRLEDVLDIQRGLCAAAARSGCRVGGGDVSAIGGPLVIDVVVLGTTAPGRELRRDAGRPGDALVVTGSLGRAAAGLQILFGNLEAPAALDQLWRSAQLHPRARIDEGIALAEGGVRCGGDLSDGLLVDLGRILAASSCGAELWLDAVPVDPEMPGLLGARWRELVLGGGEDFELLAAVDPQVLPRLREGWPGNLAPLRVIGRLEGEPGLRLLASPGGEREELPRILSRHYSR